MFKIFKKNKENKKSYSVVFCNTNNTDTAFGIYGTYDSYEIADHVIRMAWNKRKDQRVNDGYQIDGGWIVIKEN